MIDNGPAVHSLTAVGTVIDDGPTVAVGGLGGEDGRVGSVQLSLIYPSSPRGDIHKIEGGRRKHQPQVNHSLLPRGHPQVLNQSAPRLRLLGGMRGIHLLPQRAIVLYMNEVHTSIQGDRDNLYYLLFSGLDDLKILTGISLQREPVTDAQVCRAKSPRRLP